MNEMLNQNSMDDSIRLPNRKLSISNSSSESGKEGSDDENSESHRNSFSEEGINSEGSGSSSESGKDEPISASQINFELTDLEKNLKDPEHEKELLDAANKIIKKFEQSTLDSSKPYVFGPEKHFEEPSYE